MLAAERTTPEQARRSWPRWLAGGVTLLVVAVTAVFWGDGGASLLLGAAGALAAARGAALARGPRRGAAVAALLAGTGAVAVALASAEAAGWVLLIAVPLGLLGGALTLLGRGGAERRGGQAGLVWWALVTGLLLVTGVLAGWERAAAGATVVGALVLGLIAVVLLVGAAHLRALAARPAPARPAACAGCACGAGGCGLPR